MKDFKEFLTDMETDAELGAKIKEAVKEIAPDDEKTLISQLVKIACEMGYEVSVEDFSRHQADSHKLDDEELKFVTGGAYDMDCVFSEYCPGILKHCYSSNRCNFNIFCSETGKIYRP